MERARVLALDLDQENRLRQGIEEKILNQAVAMVESWPDLSERRSLVLASREWHPGVIGIVASRLVERFHRPTSIALDDARKGSQSQEVPSLWKGSSGGCWRATVATARPQDCRSKPSACRACRALRGGCTIAPERRGSRRDRSRCRMDLSCLTHRRWLRSLVEPYGQGNPEPDFGSMRGKDRLRITLSVRLEPADLSHRLCIQA